jgi:putative hydrolase of the HAD superfamily
MIGISDILEVEKYIDDVEVVLFDLDDTLYLERDYVRSGYKKIAEYLNMPYIEEEMWNVFLSGGKAIDEVLEKYNLLNRKEEALNVYRFQEPDITLSKEVKEMLYRIKQHKKVGIITDGRPEGQRAKIKALDLKVDKIIITDELGGTEFRKPCPKAFQLMKEYFDIEYQNMIYIGDNINKDFIAPKKLGMKYIWFKNKDGLYK